MVMTAVTLVCFWIGWSVTFFCGLRRSTTEISVKLAQMGQEMRREVARRDDELTREREELSFDAVDDMHQDVSPSLSPSPA